MGWGLVFGDYFIVKGGFQIQVSPPPADPQNHQLGMWGRDACQGALPAGSQNQILYQILYQILG